jgi:glycosyltransferase involved in cell wall biosynthesis
MSYPYAESKIDQARHGFVPRPWLTRWRGRFIRLVLYRLVLPLADHVFVQSEQMRRDVAREGIDPARMTSVPMGIRDDQVGLAQDARAPDPRKPVLLYLGILLRLRQTEMLVDVLHRVRQHVPGARLVYVGEGVHASDRQAIVDEARRLGEEQAVEITGFLPMEQAWARVREADICFSPFQPIPVLQSTSPTKLIEYMAMAKCVVGNEHPEQGEVMRESGVGAPVSWDVQAFTDAVLALLADPEAARRQAARGPDYVRKWRTYGVIANAVESMYLRIVN